MDMELESSCFGMEGSKMEGGLIKMLGRATLKERCRFSILSAPPPAEHACMRACGQMYPNVFSFYFVETSLIFLQCFACQY